MKVKGSITIFLALTLLLMVGIIGSLLESTRVTVSREVVTDDAYLSVQNILAEYQREVWNDYHVFFIDAGELNGTDGLKKLGNDYLSKMLNSVESDFIGTTAKFDDIEFKENMTEKDCSFFTKQVVAYMKYGTASSLGKKFFKNAEAIRSCEKGAKALKNIVKVKTEAVKIDYNNILDAFLVASIVSLPERLVRLVEQNIRVRYNKDFRADNMFAGISADVSLIVKPRIFRISFLNSLLDSQERNGWKSIISINQSLCKK